METNSSSFQVSSKNIFEVPTEKNNRIVVEFLNEKEINTDFNQLDEFDF